MYTSRRDFLAGLASALTFPALAARAEQRVDEVEPHLQIAEQARRTAGSKRSLKLLLPAGSEANVKPVAKLFESLSGIKVAITTAPVDDVATELMLMESQQEQRYDLALPPSFSLPGLIDHNIIRPLTRYRDQHEPAVIRQQALFSAADSHLGEFYGYQSDGDVYLMFYNSAFLYGDGHKRFEDHFGEEYHTPTTWAQADAHMAFFHAPDQQRYGGLLYRTPMYLCWEFWARLHANGVLPLNDDLSTNFLSDAALEALDSLIRVTDYLHPQVFAADLETNWDLYGQGHTYANIGWGGTQKYLRQFYRTQERRTRCTTLPGLLANSGRTPVSSFNWGWNYVVLSRSDAPELAYLFMLFAASPHPSALAVRERDGFFDPFQKRHYADSSIVDVYGPEFLRTHNTAIEEAIPGFYISGHERYFAAMSEYLWQAVQGNLRPEDALNALDKRWQQLHQQNSTSKISRQWQSLKSRYPSAYLEQIAL